MKKGDGSARHPSGYTGGGAKGGGDDPLALTAVLAEVEGREEKPGKSCQHSLATGKRSAVKPFADSCQ